jgi:hypothetical protein
MRRHRERRRDGYRCVSIEVHRAEIRALIRRGFLSEADRDDSAAIVDAIHAFLDREFGGDQRRQSENLY